MKLRITLLRSITPYLVGLLIAVALYLYADTIDYTPRPGTLGPEIWPHLAILLLGGSCLFEIVRRLTFGNEDGTGLLEAFERDEEPAQKDPVYPMMLIGGIVLLGVYAVLIPYLGFIFGTFLFLPAFMYIGGFRRHSTIWLTTILVTASCGVLFLRIAYVSLPRGIEPFSMATDIFFKIPSLW
jgi:hypothetical protein